jgi:hypothetical protein
VPRFGDFDFGAGFFALGLALDFALAFGAAFLAVAAFFFTTTFFFGAGFFLAAGFFFFLGLVGMDGSLPSAQAAHNTAKT